MGHPTAPSPPLPPPTPDRPGRAADRPTAAAAARVGSSTVRDLLHLVTRPDVISLAGGLPDPATFPVAELAAATDRVLATAGRTALQYGPTEGDAGLRDWIRRHRRAAAGHDVLVTHGSQQALDLVVRAAVGPGDAVAVADPAYVGTLQVLRLAGAHVVGIRSDAHGLVVDDLAARLAEGLRPRLVYTVATLHNPTGATMPGARRRALAALADRYGFWIVDDDPYGELRWSAEPPPRPLADLSDRVLTLGSFSKVLSPGLRVGYVVGPAAVIRDLVVVKQATDLHTATTNQAIVHEVVAAPGWLAGHLAALRATYAARADALDGALHRHLGGAAQWSRPDGGMFVWLTLGDDRADTTALLPDAVAAGVAFVPGPAFAVDRDLRRSLRLSFATAPPPDLDEAVRRLATVLPAAVAAG